MLAGVFGDPGVALAGVDDFSKRGADAVVTGVAGGGVECNVAGTGEQLVVAGFVQSDEGAVAQALAHEGAVAKALALAHEGAQADIVESLGTLDIRLAAAGSGD